MTENKKRKIYTYEGKVCRVCFKDLNADNVRPCDIIRANYLCIACGKAYSKQRYIDKKEIIREQQRIYDFSVKQKIIEAYGGKCTCCGETTLEFLTIDHINNDGAEDRRQNGKKSGGKLYRWLIKNNFPKEDYQLLCYNCNCAKGFFGYCPHDKPEIVVRPTRNASKQAG